MVMPRRKRTKISPRDTTQYIKSTKPSLNVYTYIRSLRHPATTARAPHLVGLRLSEALPYIDVGIANIAWAGAIEPYHVAHEVAGLCLRGVLHAEAHVGLIAHPHVDREDYPPLVNGEQAQILSSIEKRVPRY